MAGVMSTPGKAFLAIQIIFFLSANVNFGENTFTSQINFVQSTICFHLISRTNAVFT